MCTGKESVGYQGFAPLNLTELQHPASYNETCQDLDISMESTTNGPYLSMPPDLNGVDPAWHTCIAVYWGAFDPPIALHTATALVQDSGKQSPRTPAPGSPVAPLHAPATPTAPPIDPGKPETQSPAPNALPQDTTQQDPHSSDPSNSPDNKPKPDPQDPDQSKTGPPDPVQSPAHNNNGGHATSAAVTVPFDGENVAQEHLKAVSDTPANHPHPAGEVSEGDPVADPVNAYDAGPLLSAAGAQDQSPADRAQPLPSIGGHQIQAASGGGVIIASTTIQRGQKTTIDGTPLSVVKGYMIIASSTIPLALPSADPIITLINGDIISAGGQAATVNGTTVALAPNDDALVVNGKTSPIPPPPTPIFTIARQTLTPAPTGFAIGGQSVLPGGPAITFAGSTFSLATGSKALIVNGKPTPLPAAPISIFRVGSQTLTATPTGFAVGTQSVSPGAPAVMVDGTLISLGSSELVIGTSTVPLGSVAPTGAGALGSLIMHGLGGGAGGAGTANPTNGSSNVSDVQPFLGGGGKLRVGFGMVFFALSVNFGTATVL